MRAQRRRRAGVCSGWTSVSVTRRSLSIHCVHVGTGLAACGRATRNSVSKANTHECMTALATLPGVALRGCWQPVLHVSWPGMHLSYRRVQRKTRRTVLRITSNKIGSKHLSTSRRAFVRLPVGTMTLKCATQCFVLQTGEDPCIARAAIEVASKPWRYEHNSLYSAGKASPSLAGRGNRLRVTSKH